MDSQEPTRAGNPPLAAICRGRGTGTNATDNDGHGTTVFQPLQWSGARGASASEWRVRARTAAAAETQFGGCSCGGKTRDRRCGQQWAWPGAAARKGHRWRRARLASAARGRHYDPGGAAARRGSNRTRLLPVRRPDRPVVRGEEGPLQRQLLLCFPLAPVRACEEGLGLIERAWLPCKLRLSFCGSSKKSPSAITLMAGASAGLGGL
jgi:hypothetical protein